MDTPIINFSDERLRKLLKACTRLVLLEARKQYSRQPITESVFTWKRVNGSDLQSATTSKPIVSFAIHDGINRSADSEEFKELNFYIDSVEALSKQLDTLVGSPTSAVRIERTDLIRAIATECFLDYESDELDNELFERLYKDIENFLYSENIVQRCVIPLAGLTIDQDHFELSEISAFRKFTDSEITKILGFGIHLGENFGNSNYYTHVQEFAIIQEWLAPKIIGENRTPPTALREDSTEEFERVLGALRIFKKGKVRPIARINYDLSPFRSGTSYQKMNSGNLFLPAIHLSGSELIEFKNLLDLHLTKDTYRSSFVNVCIRRFSQSTERDSIEDKIIDLMIAAEAFFLSSSGNFQGELKYRLSHRCAMFLGESAEEQQYYFTFMQRAYDVRSNIIHGSEPKLPKKHDGSKYLNIQDFTDDLEELMRSSLKKAVTVTQMNEAEFNWNSIVFR